MASVQSLAKSAAGGDKASSSQLTSMGVTNVAKYTAALGYPSTTSSNPVVSATKERAQNERLGVDLTDLRAAYAADAAMLQQQQAALAERRKTEVEGIKTDFDIASKTQKESQGKDYAARSTSLVTSGGGFLGATQSQEGVLQNLEKTFDTERTALMAKREAAINAANIAYEDKDFALARELSKNARDLQTEIYNRQKDYAEQTLTIARENRAQTEFDMGITDKKIKAYAAMDDATFATQNPAEIARLDSSYYPGYTAQARVIERKAQDIKTRKDAVDLDSDILDMRLKMPYGQSFTLGGQTYTGLRVDKDTFNDGLGNTTYSGESLPMTEEIMVELEALGVETGDIIKIQDLLNRGYSLKKIAETTKMPATVYNVLASYIEKP